MTRIMLLAAMLSAAAPAAAAPKRPHAAFSPDGSRIAFMADGSKLRVLDASGTLVSETPLGSPASEIAYSSDGKKVAVCTEWTGLFVLVEGRKAADRLEPAGDCSDLNWSADGSKLSYVLTLTGTLSTSLPLNSRAVKVWNAATRATQTLHTAAVETEPNGPAIPGLSYPTVVGPPKSPPPSNAPFVLPGKGH